MTALRDISTALDQEKAKRTGKLFSKSLVIRVGDSASRAIRAETSDKQLPKLIGGVRVVETSAFRGWAIEEG